MSLAIVGKNAVLITVKLPPAKAVNMDRLADGLRDQFRRGDFTDVVLQCGGQSFPAHRCVLATMSEIFRHGLATPAGATSSAPTEVRLADIANPEAVKYMLDYIYGIDTNDDYNPYSLEMNNDVLRLSQNFKLTGLQDRAERWLAKGLSTANAVERLSICDSFGLMALHEKIVEQLTCNKKALAQVASSAEIMAHPKLMQALLRLVSNAAFVDVDEPAQKKARKLGA